MALVRFEPDAAGAMLDLQNELERFLRNPALDLGVSGLGAYPNVNIFESPDALLLMAEVPGLDPGAIEVSAEGETLTIKGSRTAPPSGNGIRGYHRRERPIGEFSRSIQLPARLQLDKAQARYEAGMLILRVPKAEHAKAKQIAVQSA